MRVNYSLEKEESMKSATNVANFLFENGTLTLKDALGTTLIAPGISRMEVIHDGEEPKASIAVSEGFNQGARRESGNTENSTRNSGTEQRQQAGNQGHQQQAGGQGGQQGTGNQLQGAGQQTNAGQHG